MVSLSKFYLLLDDIQVEPTKIIAVDLKLQKNGSCIFNAKKKVNLEIQTECNTRNS